MEELMKTEGDGLGRGSHSICVVVKLYDLRIK